MLEVKLAFAAVTATLALVFGLAFGSCTTPIHSPPVVNPTTPSCPEACARFPECPYQKFCADLCEKAGDPELLRCLYTADTCEAASACDPGH